MSRCRGSHSVDTARQVFEERERVSERQKTERKRETERQKDREPHVIEHFAILMYFLLYKTMHKSKQTAWNQIFFIINQINQNNSKLFKLDF